MNNDLAKIPMNMELVPLRMDADGMPLVQPSLRVHREKPRPKRVFSPAWRLRWEARKLLRKAARWLMMQMGDDVTLPGVAVWLLATGGVSYPFIKWFLG